MGIKIVYDRSGCIGAATCEALDPADFELVEDGLADLKDADDVDGDIWTKHIPDERKDDALDAARGCPVNVIKIIDTDTDEQLYP